MGYLGSLLQGPPGRLLRTSWKPVGITWPKRCSKGKRGQGVRSHGSLFREVLGGLSGHLGAYFEVLGVVLEGSGCVMLSFVDS